MFNGCIHPTNFKSLYYISEFILICGTYIRLVNVHVHARIMIYNKNIYLELYFYFNEILYRDLNVYINNNGTRVIYKTTYVSKQISGRIIIMVRSKIYMFKYSRVSYKISPWNTPWNLMSGDHMMTYMIITPSLDYLLPWNVFVGILFFKSGKWLIFTKLCL